MQINQEISAALNENALNLSVPIVVENKDFTPTGDPYAQLTLLPADTDHIGLEFDSNSIHIGIFQIDVFTKQGSGSHDQSCIIDELFELFPRGKRLNSNGINVDIQEVSRGTGARDGGYYITPVFVEYHCVV